MAKKGQKAKAKPTGAKSAYLTASSTGADAKALEQKQPRRQLARRDTDEQVNRALETHFRGVSKSAVETKSVSGMLLRTRVARDLRAARFQKNKARLSTCYWRDLRRLYGEESELHRIEVTDAEPASECAQACLG